MLYICRIKWGANVRQIRTLGSREKGLAPDIQICVEHRKIRNPQCDFKLWDIGLLIHVRSGRPVYVIVSLNATTKAK